MDNEDVLHKVLAQHFFRQGRFGIGKTFVKVRAGVCACVVRER